jgi:hypothetical protein
MATFMPFGLLIAGRRLQTFSVTRKPLLLIAVSFLTGDFFRSTVLDWSLMHK